MQIPDPKTTATNKYIPEKVALNPYRGDPEGEPFLISFQFFNDKISEISSLSGSASKRFVKDIRTIGGCNNTTLDKNNIKRQRVYCSGEYKKLFRKLPEDVEELREHKGAQTSRLFYFYAGKYMYIIAITQNHLETKKVRK
ncbi:hypothetical protein GF362_03185 [Candidatus Dojkabacteria bacterium]|nr:hypothetical protein [Candidatus Dojkabacteria bacterium]